MISNWISAALTVERALTIMFPLKFRSQDMPRNSKYVIPIIVVLVILGNIPTHLFFIERKKGLYFATVAEIILYIILLNRMSAY